MAVTLRLTSTTTVRVINLVHGNTTDRGSDVQPAASSSLAQLSVMMVDVAGNANGGTGILADPTHFTTLEPHLDVLSGHDLGSIVLGLFVLVDDDRRGSGTATEHSASLGGGTDSEDGGTDGNHVHWQTVSPESGLRGEDTGINDTAHAVEEILRNASAVAVNDISGPQSIRSEDISVTSCGLLGDEGNVGTSSGVILNALYQMRPRAVSDEVDGSYPSLRTTSTVSHGNSTRHISATLRLALLGKGQWEERPAFPQMVVDGTPQMSHTGSARLVGSENGGLAACSFRTSSRCLGGGSTGAGRRGGCDCGVGSGD